jgi:phosphoribosylformimino-5-aminoimidazole carboxamide ribotide isomerase
MIIIPAIDLKNGNCVRLLQGKMDQETIYSLEPEKMAVKWQEEGAEIIHVVDLDGAVGKHPKNIAAIRRIIENVKIDVQVGGGIRNEDVVNMFLDLGAARVIIGTEAIKNPKLVRDACKNHPGRIVVGIDARNGMVAIEGWTKTTNVQAMDLAKQFEDCGVAAINFTDIHRDGMQTGPNIEETRRLAASISIPVVASGGVSTIEDVKRLLPLEEVGVTGIITGKALYAGTMSLREAIQLTRQTT